MKPHTPTLRMTAKAKGNGKSQGAMRGSLHYAARYSRTAPVEMTFHLERSYLPVSIFRFITNSFLLSKELMVRVLLFFPSSSAQSS